MIQKYIVKFSGDSNVGKILTGQKDIQHFVGRAWNIIYRWIKHKGFPARKIDGRWESDSDMIIEWRKRQILEHEK